MVKVRFRCRETIYVDPGTSNSAKSGRVQHSHEVHVSTDVD